MEKIRFFLAGYEPIKGYAIKDLQDCKVEYFSGSDVVKLSKSVKIFGVDNDKLDVDWFKSYYSRFVMAYGESSARSELGLALNSEGDFIIASTKHFGVGRNFDFIEMIGSFTVNIEGSINGELTESMYETLFDYIVSNNSGFFHFRSPKNQVVKLPARLINGINIQNILIPRAMVSFNYKYDNPIIVYDLKMHNCIYEVNASKEVWLVNSPHNAIVNLGFSHNNGTLYISRNFNLKQLILDSKNLPIRTVRRNKLDYEYGGTPRIYIQEGVNTFDLCNILKVSNIKNLGGLVSFWDFDFGFDAEGYFCMKNSNRYVRRTDYHA